MQTAAVERVVKNSGTMASAEFGISQVHAAHIMGILRSTLYSRKALAVLREYGTNAWDEHRQCGKGDTPIKVHMPTAFKPTLKIRDFGRGLSEHDVLHIYTQYGESTKRNTNDAAGMLGIGGKSAFCYADQFTVTSWHAGQKSIYVAVLDQSNKGRMDKIHEEPCGNETGIEIQVAVKSRDVDEFHREARGLFRYFNPQPEINMILSDLPKGMTKGFVSEDKHNTDWIVIMGCIPYRLDLTQLQEKLVESGYWDALGKLGGGIYLPIGSVEFSASREELQYTEKTTQVLTDQFIALVQEYVDDALSAINRPDVKPWDRRLRATFLHHVLKFPLPKAFESWTEQGVPLWSKAEHRPKTFNLVNAAKDLITRITIKQDARILILDDKSKALKGWHFNNSDDSLAVPIEVDGAACTYEQVQAEIEALTVLAEIDGVTISPLTTRSWWSPPHRANGRRQYPPNHKHKDRTFTLKDRWSDLVPRSAHWNSAKPPEDDHVFVILSGFIPEGTSLRAMQDDQVLLKGFGVEWPTIYGYKNTPKKPVNPKDIEKGTTYKTWRAETFQGLITDAVKTTLRDLAWCNLFSNIYYRDRKGDPVRFHVHDLIAKLSFYLGDKHPMTRYFVKHVEGKREISRLVRGRVSQVKDIAKAVGWINKRSAPQKWLDRLWVRYPMLNLTSNTPETLVQSFILHDDTILKYIKDQDIHSRGSTETSEA